VALHVTELAILGPGRTIRSPFSSTSPLSPNIHIQVHNLGVKRGIHDHM